MWFPKFEQRLDSWSALRSQVSSMPTVDALSTINRWWAEVPWEPYYLHWDDKDTWPDPWQLLNDNIYCDVAKSLGILYTLSILERDDFSDAKMILTTQDYTLVVVCNGTYILNWEKDSVVNNIPSTTSKRIITLPEIKEKI